MDGLLLLTLLLGFYMAWNIGANDVANAMGTSVGSKALTMKKAVILAAILEFSGAFFVGSNVSETIQHGIVLPEVFSANPTIFVIGMMGSLLATGVMLQVASYFGLPISTTHAIVGAVVGFGAVVGGIHAIQWTEVVKIATSWVISPILSGLVAYGIFNLVQKKVLFALDPLRATQRLVPLLAFACFVIASLSFCYQGLAPLHLDLSPQWAISISLSVGMLAFFVSSLLLRRAPLAARAGIIINVEKEVYLGVEKIFVYLQIVTACLVAFAHGANDVANAIGPVAAVIAVLKTNALQSHTPIPSWLLALGGGGIVIGLATWGWRVIETIGEKITELTPTRGFCAEFGTATTVLLASKLGLPISTTHALVGAVLGVGMARGIQALNLQMVKEIVLSWIVTIPLCAITSILAFYALRALFL
jgi:phosphate/sulfate permease